MLEDPVVTPRGRTCSRAAARALHPQPERLYPDIIARKELAAWRELGSPSRELVIGTEDPITGESPRYAVTTCEGHTMDLASLALAWTRARKSPLTGSAIEPCVRYNLRVQERLAPERASALRARIAERPDDAEVDLDALAEQIRAIRKDGRKLAEAPTPLKENGYVIGDALSTHPGALDDVPPEAIDDALLARPLEVSPEVYARLSPKAQRDPEVLRTLVTSHATGLGRVPEDLKSKPLILMALRAHGNALEHVPEALRADLDVLEAAIRSTPAVYGTLSETLRESERLQRAVVEAAATMSRDAVQEIRAVAFTIRGGHPRDPEYVVRDFHRAHQALLGREVTTLRADERVSLQVAERAAKAIKRLDAAREVFEKYPHLRRPELFAVAARIRPEVIRWVPWGLRLSHPELVVAGTRTFGARALFEEGLLPARDRALMLRCAAVDGMTLRSLGQALRNDRALVLAAVEQNGEALEYASSALRADEEVVSVAVQSRGWALQFAAPALRGDREIVSWAVLQDGMALEFASAELRDDPELVSRAVQQNGLALEFASMRLRDDPEVVKAAVKKTPKAFRFASSRLRADRELALFAVERRYQAIRLVAHDLRGDLEFMSRVVEVAPASLPLAPHPLRRALTRLRPLRGAPSPTIVRALAARAVQLNSRVAWSLPRDARRRPEVGEAFVARSLEVGEHPRTFRAWLSGPSGLSIATSYLQNARLSKQAYARLSNTKEYQKLLAQNPALAEADAAARARLQAASESDARAPG